MMRSLICITCLASVAFGFPSASYRAFAFRGSSQASTSRETLLHLSPIEAVDQFFIDSPYTAAALVCGVKASAADGVAQFQEWKDAVLPKTSDDDDEATKPGEVADFKRNAAFVAYGALYQGLTQEFIFNHLYPVWFGTGTEWTVVVSKVAFSLLVQTTLLTLPSLYLIKAVMEQTSISSGLEKYVDDVQNQQLLQKFYLLWGPVLTLTFSVIPEQFRIAFIAVVSFFWLIILSGISSNTAPEPTPAEKDLLCIVGEDVCEFEKNT